MDKNFKILFVVVLMILISCGVLIYFSIDTHNFFNNGNLSSTENSNNSSKIIVVASVLPQKEFIEKVGGDRVQVVIMVPPGADPHTYEPKASQLQQITHAQVYVQVGSGIEFEMVWMDKIKSLNKNMVIINDSKGINLISNPEIENNQFHNSGESESDPHVWVSPKNAEIMVENIYNGLVEIDPKNKEYYFINKENYLKQLRQLDRNITNELYNKKGSKLVVYHPSWGYFCRDYGLNQMAIEKNGKDPTPKEMMNLVNQIKNNNITSIFVSPQYSARSAEVIASETGCKLVYINELDPDYINNINKLANALKNE